MPDDGVEVHCAPIHDWDAARHVTARAGGASRREAEHTTPFLFREPVDATARDCNALSLPPIPHPFP